MAALAAGGMAAADPEGRLRVIDGDTVDIGGERVRLFGIDAPERDQTCRTAAGAAWDCGLWAAEELDRRFGDARVTCAGRGRDDYGRTLAVCTADGVDVGRALVRAGIALAYRTYAMDYDLEEKSAQLEALGLWAGEFETPAAHRAAARAALAAAEVPADGCVIKGNISDAGHIYHVPGQRDYAATRISEARGERWFCTPAEAEAAGWRPARN